MPYNLDERKLEEIKDLNDIVDIIGEYIDLKKTGTNYKGLCPFHNEKTPSFVISPEKQIYHCFGCGEGGDVLSFLMKNNNYSFIEAVEYLADKAGIKLELETKENQSNKNKLYEINREAGLFFIKNLSANEKALGYLLNRKINSKTIKRFGIGYAPDNWEELYQHLKGKGFNEENILETGLIIKRKNTSGYYDRFRNRIMFPIIDTKKKVIGFGGRVLDNSVPKYLNSPDSEIFSKGRYLFNLNLAKKDTKNRSVILTEGYMDVIKLSSFGYKNTVASLGTAFTEYQIKLLKKYFNEFYIAYDSDNSGKKASIKALSLFKKYNIDSKVVVLPSKMDPDDYITKFGSSKFKQRMNEAYDYYKFLDEYYTSKFDIESNKGKLKYIDNFLRELSSINNSIERELLIEKISEKTQISKENLLDEYRKKFSKKNIKFKRNIKKDEKIKLNTDEILSNHMKVLIDFIKDNEETYEYTISRYKDELSKIYGEDFQKYLDNKNFEFSNNNSTTTEEIDFITKKIIIKYQEKQLFNLRQKLKDDPNNQCILNEINEIYIKINKLRRGGNN